MYLSLLFLLAAAYLTRHHLAALAARLHDFACDVAENTLGAAFTPRRPVLAFAWGVPDWVVAPNRPTVQPEPAATVQPAPIVESADTYADDLSIPGGSATEGRQVVALDSEEHTPAVVRCAVCGHDTATWVDTGEAFYCQPCWDAIPGPSIPPGESRLDKDNWPATQAELADLVRDYTDLRDAARALNAQTEATIAALDSPPAAPAVTAGDNMRLVYKGWTVKQLRAFLKGHGYQGALSRLKKDELIAIAERPLSE